MGGKRISGVGSLVGALLGYLVYQAIIAFHLIPALTSSRSESIAMQQGLICAACVMIGGFLGRIIGKKKN